MAVVSGKKSPGYCNKFAIRFDSAEELEHRAQLDMRQLFFAALSFLFYS